MATNSSSSSDLTPPTSSSSLNVSFFVLYNCFDSTLGSYIFTSFFGTYVLFFLPLCIFILYLGHQRWQKQMTTSSDVYTYNIIVMEMIGMVGCSFYCAGVYTKHQLKMLVGVYVFSIITPGQMLFHILTCVERYLAVVHPVFYLQIKKSTAVRSVCIICVWVVSMGWIGLTAWYSPDFSVVPFAVLLVCSLVATCFCGLSILYVLIRPGPGELGGDKDKMNQSKRRAFHTIMVITGALLFRFLGQLLCVAVEMSGAVDYSDTCVVLMSGSWFALPSSYILPLSFLQRAGKLQCFKPKTESG